MSFKINWILGSEVSVLFSDGPISEIDGVKYDTPYSVPDCPLEDQDALIAHISNWWVANKPATPATATEHELVGRTFELAPSAPLVS